MIGILGGMGTQAGLDFCNKLAKINRGKLDQQYPLFILYNKSDTPKRPENLKKYFNVLNALVKGCKMLQKNKCKFIVMPCNTAHYWYEDIQKKINIPIVSMPKEVFLDANKTCKKKVQGGTGRDLAPRDAAPEMVRLLLCEPGGRSYGTGRRVE